MQKVKKNDTFIRPYLSLKDEYVPDDCISIYEMFILSSNMKNLYGEKVAKELRKKTYNNVLKLYEEDGADDYTKFWNFHVEEISEMRLNEFAKFEPLEPYCRYIEAFKKKKKSNGKIRWVISFGIKKSTIEKFLEEKERCRREDIPFIPPTIKKGRKPIKEMIDFGTYQLYTGNVNEISIEKGALYERFKKWAALQGITLREAGLMAINSVIDLYPVDDLEELSDFQKITVFDKNYLAKKDVFKEIKPYKANINGETFCKAEKILYRYNLDPTNVCKEKNMNQYVNEALELMNSKMPLKYSNPDLYEQYKELKDQKEFFNNDSNCNESR